MPSEPSMTEPRRARAGGFVLSMLAFTLFAIINAPYQYVDVEGQWRGSYEIDGAGGYLIRENMPRMAGWPLRYWVRYEIDGVQQDRYWSTSKLVGNIALGCALATTVFLLFLVRGRQFSDVNSQTRAKKIFDIGIASAILIVPGLIVANAYRTAAKHQRLASQFLGYGNYYLSSWVPEIVANQAPKGLLQPYRRLRQVYLVRAPEELVQRAAELPTLVVYDVRGGVSPETLKVLTDNPYIESLQLDRFDVQFEHVDVIVKLKWLNQLRLTHTRLTPELFHHLDEMQHLQIVDIRSTTLRADELGTPSWSQRVETLYLPRVRDGLSDTLTIAGWPKLRRLGMTRFSRINNPTTIEVRLIDLPNLESLQLDRNQKHELHLQDLPRLQFIDEGMARFEELLDSSQFIPGLTWVSDLQLDGVSSLKKFGCYAPDLKRLSIRNAPNLRELELGSFKVTMLGSRKYVEADPALCQAWLDYLGEVLGPTSVVLTNLPLANQDLSRLSMNPRIRKLRFDRCEISFDQIRQLEGMKQLEALSIPSCEVVDDQLNWLLESFPNLEELSVDGSLVTNCDLSEGAKLKKADLNDLKQATHIRMVGRPSLATTLRIAQTPQQLDLQNARSLQGLAVESPWPKDAVVEGVRDLQWFAGGGKFLNDKIIAEILRCNDMGQLTLAYSSVSREGMIKLGQFNGLTMLAVPGSDVDDQITSHWHKLEFIWDLNFDDTKISTATIDWVSRIDSLRRLSINRVPLSSKAARSLGELRQISELHLAGTQIDHDRLKPLLAAGNIEILNLSGWHLNDELVDLLESGFSLRYLKLQESSIDTKALTRLLRQSMRLQVDLGSEQQRARAGVNLKELPKELSRFIISETPMIWDAKHSDVLSPVTIGRIDCDIFRKQPTVDEVVGIDASDNLNQ